MSVCRLDNNIPEWEQDLRDGAQQLLDDNPGCTFENWRQALIDQYPLEVVDTFGPDEQEAEKGLMELWKQLHETA